MKKLKRNLLRGNKNNKNCNKRKNNLWNSKKFKFQFWNQKERCRLLPKAKKKMKKLRRLILNLLKHNQSDNKGKIDQKASQKRKENPQEITENKEEEIIGSQEDGQKEEKAIRATERKEGEEDMIAISKARKKQTSNPNTKQKINLKTERAHRHHHLWKQHPNPDNLKENKCEN